MAQKSIFTYPWNVGIGIVTVSCHRVTASCPIHAVMLEMADLSDPLGSMSLPPGIHNGNEYLYPAYIVCVFEAPLFISFVDVADGHGVPQVCQDVIGGFPHRRPVTAPVCLSRRQRHNRLMLQISYVVWSLRPQETSLNEFVGFSLYVMICFNFDSTITFKDLN